MLGAFFNILMLVLITALLVQYTTLWLSLLALNTPIYYSLINVFFKSKTDVSWALSNLLHGETERPTEDETWGGYHGWIFVATCLSIVTAEYKFISWLFY